MSQVTFAVVIDLADPSRHLSDKMFESRRDAEVWAGIELIRLEHAQFALHQFARLDVLLVTYNVVPAGWAVAG